MLTLTTSTTVNRFVETQDGGYFVDLKPRVYKLEHSLVSISKWESKFKIPFASKDVKTLEHDLYYIKCMLMTHHVSDLEIEMLLGDFEDIISVYVNDPMTATTFFNAGSNKQYASKVVTSELIYYWMIQYQIPIECQRWHLNRLLTLIRVFTVKGSSDKMSDAEVRRLNSDINAARREET